MNLQFQYLSTPCAWHSANKCAKHISQMPNCLYHALGNSLFNDAVPTCDYYPECIPSVQSQGVMTEKFVKENS
jgi:hypothetical protein